MSTFSELYYELPDSSREKVIAAMLDLVDEQHDQMLTALLEKVTGCERFAQWLGEEEAVSIVNDLRAADGSTGGRWNDPDALFQRVKDAGGNIEKDGAYNRWALYAVINMIYADYSSALRSVVEGERLFRTCYGMAVAFLEDPDRTGDIRWYFGLEQA